MNCFFDKQRMKSLLAGFLATMIFVMSLFGCQSKTLAKTSKDDASSVQSQSSSGTASSNEKATKSSAGSSKASSSKTASSKKSSSSAAAVKAAQKVPAKPKSAAEVGNTAIKKIAADPGTQTAPRLSVNQSTAATSGYSHIDQRSGYNFLPDSVSRNLYNQILESVCKVTLTPDSNGYYPTERISMSGTLTEAQLRVALLAVLNDNPQVFWLANVYSYGYSGNTTYIQLYSYVSQTQCSSMIQQLNNQVGAVIQAMPSGLSEFDRELYLFDFLTKKCTYDTQAVTDNSRWKSFTSYGAIVEGSVVCEGYARAMQLLSCYSGLQCILITGQSSGANHMWNLMKIDGNWYHLDTTWCDGNPVSYNYFNVTDSVITQSRTIDPSASALTAAQISGSTGCNLSVPGCTATQANYYKVKGIPITDLSGATDSAITQAISQALKQKSASISFYVAVNADYNTVLDKISACLINASKESGVAISSSLNYITDEPDNGITVFVTYK